MSCIVRVKKCPKCAASIPVACKACTTCGHVFLPRRAVCAPPYNVTPLNFDRRPARTRARQPAPRYSPEPIPQRSYAYDTNLESKNDINGGAAAPARYRRPGRRKNQRNDGGSVEEALEMDARAMEETWQPPRERAYALSLTLMDLNRKLMKDRLAKKK